MNEELENDAEAEAAFNEGSTGTETKADATTPTATPEKTAEAAPTVVAEPKFAQITEDELNQLRARVASIDEMRGTSEKSFGTAFGKIGGIERALNELRGGGQAFGEFSKDDFSELQDAFPELAEMTIQGFNRALAKLKGAPAIDPAKVDELVQLGITTTLQQRELDSQKEAVKALDADHADWRAVKEKPEFKEWLTAQPTRFQRTYAKTWDADFLSDAFTNFKEAAAKAAPTTTSTTRKDRLAAAVNPRGTGGHAAGPSEDDDFDAGFKQG